MAPRVSEPGAAANDRETRRQCQWRHNRRTGMIGIAACRRGPFAGLIFRNYNGDFRPLRWPWFSEPIWSPF
jgi:hypothetical protein